MASVSPLLMTTVGVERARVDHRGARDGGAAEGKDGVGHLVADFGLHIQGDEVVLVNGGRDNQRVAKFLVWKPPNTAVCGLRVEVELVGMG